MKIKDFILEILFPRFCLSCQEEGSFLCEDCKATIDIFDFHNVKKEKYLDDVFFATDYNQPLVNFLIKNYKYEPFIKELAKDLTSLILAHFSLLDKNFDFSDFIILPIPLEKDRLKWRNYNQAEEIGKILAEKFKIPIFTDVLIKKRKTKSQAQLKREERILNVAGVFAILNEEKIKGKNVLLIDDVFTTGTTLNEAARVLKEAGAKKVIGIVVAREF